MASSQERYDDLFKDSTKEKIGKFLIESVWGQVLKSWARYLAMMIAGLLLSKNWISDSIHQRFVDEATTQILAVIISVLVWFWGYRSQIKSQAETVLGIKSDANTPPEFCRRIAHVLTHQERLRLVKTGSVLTPSEMGDYQTSQEEFDYESGADYGQNKPDQSDEEYGENTGTDPVAETNQTLSPHQDNQ